MRNLLVRSLRYAVLFPIAFGLLAHSLKAATPIDALKFWKNFFLTGDYVVGGVGLRGKGVRDATLNLSLASGEINIGDTTVPNGSSPIPVTNGVPGDIIGALLYWQTDEPASAAKPSAWLGYFDGQQIIGDVVGDPNNLSCEQTTTKYGRLYRADVLRFLAIDRTNNVRIGNGKHSVRLRDDGPAGPFLTNGASLVLIYRTVIPGSPTAVRLKSVVIYDGPFNFNKKSGKLEQITGGFYQADQTTPNYSLATRMSVIVGNGQPSYAENLNVTTSIGPGSFANPFRGLAGARWDNPTFNIFQKKNDSSYAMQMTADAPVCLTVGVLVTSVPVVDTDRDGNLDVWETKGMHLNKQASPATFGGCSDYPNEANKCVNLPAMGANPAKQDIFIETDWFKGADHEHALKLAAVNELGAAFARHNIALHIDAGNKLLDSTGKPLSPYIIPAAYGKGGEVINESDLLCATVNAAISRNIKPGSVLDELQKQGKLGDLGCTFPDADLGYPALSYKRGFLFVKDGFPLANLPGHFDSLRKDIFHYIFSAHALATFDQDGKPTKDPVTGKVVPLSVSGVADKPGADIMMTLGLWRSDVLADDRTGSPTQQGGTIMHELGHNFGLSHAGLLRTPACMSNYQSSMNYQYQTRGMSDAQGKAHPDFSNGLLRPTTEGTLSEVPGSLGTLTYRVRFYGPQVLPGEGTAKGHCDGTPIIDGKLAVRAENRDLLTLDWNRNGKQDSQTSLFDANFDGIAPQSSTNAQSFVDSNDWASLNLQQVGARLNTNGLSVSIGSLDIGSLDIGSLDIGSLDIGSLDIGSLDIGSLYGSLDIGSLDIGSLDIGSLDIGSLDIGSLDIGSLDIGSLDIGERDFESEIKSGIDAIDPAQPLTATNNRTNNVDFIALNWGAATLGQIQRYNIFRARGTNPLAQDFALLATVERNGNTPPATTYNDQVNDFVNSGSDCPNPQNTCYNTTYTYYIVAVEASNLVESGASNQASSKMTHLFVIADDKTVMYGNALPATTFKIFGEVLGTLSGVSCVYSPVAPRNAGNYPIVCSGPLETSPKDGVTYNASYRDSTGLHTPGMLTITPAPLTLTATTNTKTYDANITAAATPMPTGLKYNDTAVPTAETYDTKDAGTGKTLGVSGYTINDGNGGNNYIVTTTPDNTGVIHLKQVTPSVTAANKPWDGTATATITSCSLTGVVAGETVTCSVASASFSDVNIGTNKTVTATGITIVPGPYSSNYVLTSTTATTTANIFDGTPPMVSLNIPAPNGGAGYFKTSPVAVGVSAADQHSNVSAFSCTDNGASIAVGSLTGIGTPTASGSLSVAGDGTHNLTCTSTDSVGNSGAAAGSTNSGTLKIDATAPSVSIATPANGGTVIGTTSLTANASDGLSGVVQVQYLVDGNAVGISTTGPDYAFSWNSTSVIDGSHVITGIASDAAGNTQTSAGVTITVNNNAMADLAVTVTLSPGAFPLVLTSGGMMSYRIVVTNQGLASAANVNVADTLPAGLTSVSCTTTVGTCQVNGVNVTASLGTLAPAASASVTIPAFAPAVATPITITNTASASTTSTETSTANNQVTTNTIVNPVAGPPGSLVQAFDFDPTDPNIVYAGTDSGGVFKSFDGGGHWISFLPTIVTTRVVIANGNTVHVGTSFGVYTTRDAGASWTVNAVYSVFAMAMDPTNNAIVYSGRSGSNGTVYKTTDFGATWVISSNGLPATTVDALAIDKNNTSILYAGTQGSGMFKSTDAGANWVQINTGLTGLTVQAVAIDPSNSNTVYAGTSTGVFKSTDGGANWAPANTSLANTQTFALAVDRTASGTIYAATAGGVFKSTNGAGNWAFASNGVTNPQTRAIAIDPISTNTLYLGTGWGVYKTTNAGGNWAETNTGLSGMIIAALLPDPTHPGTIYAGSGSLAGVLRSPDSGTSWARTSNNISLNLTGFALDPAGILYAATPSLGMYRSITGGANWISINTGLTNQNVRSIALDTLNPATLYIGTTNGGLFKTTNNGTNWNLSNSNISTSFPVVALAVDRTNSAVVYAGSQGAGMYKSTDGGATWALTNTGLTNLTVNVVAIDPSNNQTVYAGTSGGGVFKSTNGGASWTAMNTGLAALNVNALVIDPSNGSTLYVGTNFSFVAQIFKSTDGAATWSPSSTGLTNPIVRALALDPSNSSILFAGTAGGGVFKSTDAGATWIPSGLSLVPLPPQLTITLSERPNPVTGAGTVGFEITVTNIGGAPADNVTVTFNLPAGMTFVSCGTFINGAVGFNCNLNGTTVTALLGTVPAGATDIVGVTASVPAPVNQTFINASASLSTTSSQMSTVANLSGFTIALNPLSGPPSGNVLSLAVHPTSTNTVFAGTSNGGIFRTMNGGSTWTPINAFLSGFTVRGIAIHPLNPNLVYLATNNGTWISLEGGNSWLGFDDGINGAGVFSIAVDPSDVNVAYAGTFGGGIFKTTNQAFLWTPVNTGLTTTFIINSIVVDSSSPNTVYAASEGAGVFKTTNGGASWTAINTNLTTLDVRALAIDPTNSSTIYAATNGGGVFKSTNGGGSWTAVNSGLSSTGNHQSLLIDKTNSQVVYVGTTGGFYKSTDGGASWTLMTSGMTNPNVLASNNTAALAADPVNTATLYAGTPAGVFKTTDASSTWNAMTSGINAASVSSLTVDGANPSILYAGVNGDAWYKSVNGGATWSASNSGGLFNVGIGGFAIDPMNNAVLYAGRSGGGGPYKSTDGGLSWNFIGNGVLSGVQSGISAYVIDPANTSTVYAGGRTVTTTSPTVSGVFKTTNGGGTWATMNNGLTNTDVRAVVGDPVTPATLYAGTFGGGVFKSTDGAATWTLFSTGITNSNISSIGIDRLAPNTVYAGTFGGGIFKTTNGGTSWVQINSNLVNTNVQTVVVDPTNSNLVYTGTSGGFFKSVNGGSSWILANTGLGNSNILSLAVDPVTHTTLYAGTGGGGVFRSVDSGNTWQPTGPTLVPFSTPASITVSAGSGQSATVNTVFSTTLKALVKDSGNNPVIGTPVTFTAPAAGASGSFPGGVQSVIVTTNNSGIATAPAFTANTVAGTYNVTASAVGVVATANFSLTNLP